MTLVIVFYGMFFYGQRRAVVFVGRAMLGSGKASLAHVIGIVLHRRFDGFSEIGVAFKELGRELLAQPQHIVSDENLPIALGGCTDTNSGYGDGLGNLVGNVLVGGFDDTGEGAGLGDGLGVLHDFLSRAGVGSLCVIATQGRKGLRHQTDVSHDGNVMFHEKRYGRGDFLSAFDFDSVCARFSNDSGGMTKGKGGRLMTRSKGHIHHDAGALTGAHDGFGVLNHHRQTHRVGRLHAIKSHGDRIAHQQNVAVGVEQTSHGRALCRQAHQLATGVFARTYLRHCDTM